MLNQMVSSPLPKTYLLLTMPSQFFKSSSTIFYFTHYTTYHSTGYFLKTVMTEFLAQRYRNAELKCY